MQRSRRRPSLLPSHARFHPDGSFAPEGAAGYHDGTVHVEGSVLCTALFHPTPITVCRAQEGKR
jgi:hypothetical protein